jgi:low affinity Fe/Cu permease
MKNSKVAKETSTSSRAQPPIQGQASGPVPKAHHSSWRAKFDRIAETTANAVGSQWAFLLALLVVVAWAVTGPMFHYSDTWQLVINTGTTIITFLMVFLIQNAQNRQAKVITLKLDELLRGVEGARTSFVSLDEMSDEELECVRVEFVRLKEKFAPLVEDDLLHVERTLKARRTKH